MQKIICPVDFSERAKEALYVSASIADTCNVELLVLHVIHYPSSQSLGDDEMFVVSNMEKDTERAEERLSSLLKEVQSRFAKPLRCSFVVKTGFLTDVLNEICNEETLVVSATSGANDFISQIMGTKTRDLFVHGDFPVLVIPPKYTYIPFRKICLASDLIALPQWNVDEIIAMGKAFNAHVSFLHVLDHSKLIDVELIEKSPIHQYVQRSGHKEISFHLYQAENSAKGINHYIEQNYIDMLILTYRNRSFWEGLFEKSTSLELVSHPPIPILVFHQKVEK